MKPNAAFIICFLLISLGALAQPKANFSADVTAGCAPVVVKFQNLSSGVDNTTEYLWDLGNGTVSNLANPAAVYPDPGVYTVSLKVTTSSGADSIIRQGFISVYGKPQPAFQAGTRTGCVPTTIQFQDLSTPAAGTTNATWTWDFGDGTTSSDQNPAHVYTTPGNYTINLSITSDKGCSGSFAQAEYINIVEGVHAQFTNTQQTVCKAPVSIAFTNTSTGPPTLRYLWDFGNGKTSTQKNPTAVYDTVGSFGVKLVVRSTYGCSDSVFVVNAVTTTQVLTNFRVPPICPNTAVSFIDSSSALPVTRLWRFSDGTTDAAPSPSKIFPKAGTYTVTLINNYSTCSDSITKTLRIAPKPAISFRATPRLSCQIPLPVTFTNTTSNGSSYQWTFGDGGTATDKVPAHTYAAAGTYPVTLIATNRSGCSDTLSKPAYITIQTPVVYFKKLPMRGCLPFATQFFDSVISADRIVSYKWDLGDGTTSTAKAPKHTYTKEGTYAVSLTIKTATGCTATASVPNAVKAGTKPGKVDFTFNNASVCASQAIQFTDASTGVDEWEWEFGDGGTANIKNPSHLFLNVGTNNVMLTAYNSGCKAKAVKKSVTINAPLAKFSYKLASCADSLTYSFSNASLTGGASNLTWKWRFGDGDSSDLQNPLPHRFPALGTYTVSLFATNVTCSYNTTQTILITPRATDFTTAINTGCKPFTATITPNDLGNPQVTAYNWNFGDGTTAASTGVVNHIYSAPGNYNVSLVTTDINGCKDSSLVKASFIRVNGATAKFSGTNLKGCKGLTATFTDETTTDGQNRIANWQWDFGDGTQQNFTAPPFDHMYKNAGQFGVKLTVQDAAGCKDSVSYPAYVATSGFTIDWSGTQKTCPGAPVQFASVLNTPLYSNFWDFGNGTTSTSAAPVFAFADTGTYTVKLVVSDMLGCKDSLVRPAYTQVYRPVASFTENNLTSYCLPFQAQFTNTSAYFDSTRWDLSTGTSTQINASNFYTQVGTYNIKLRVTSPGGCADSVAKTLTVRDINEARLTYGPTTLGCRPLNVNFDAFTDLKGRFIWDFGDGSVIDTTVNKIAHTFTNTGGFTPKIVLIEPSGCLVALTGAAPIDVNGAKIKYGIDKMAFCDSGLVSISDTTTVEGSNIKYTWDFGDGTVSTQPVPEPHLYQTPGVYPLKLMVQTGEGCIDTVAIRPGIKIAVTPRIHISGDSVSCVNNVVQSIGVFDKRDTSSVQWAWLFPDGSTATVQSPPDVTFTAAGTYPIQAIASTAAGCADTAYKTIEVRPPPAVLASFPSSITTQAGFPVVLEGTYPPGTKTYLWQPAAGLSCTTCPNPDASPKFNTKYIVQYVDSNNCRNSTSVQVIVLCKNANVFVPNTFSPNGDGTNDVFYVRGRGLDRVKSLRIFDRWGEVVFEKQNFAVNDASAGWDGRHNGTKAKADVYIYQVEVFCENGDLIRFNGNVALIQ